MATELFQLRVQGRHAQEYNECVMYYQADNVTSELAIQAAKDLISNWINNALTPWLALFPATYQVERITAIQKNPKFGVEIVHQFQLGTQVGAQSGGASAQQLCPLIRWIPPNGVKTAGRNFLPCIAESDIGNGVVTSGWITRFQAFVAITIAGMNDGAIVWTQAIYSRTLNAFHKAMAADTSPIVGWQRKRQRPY